MTSAVCQPMRNAWPRPYADSEHQLHGVVDVAFREDESRIRIGHAAQNMGMVRRMAFNLLKKDTSVKVGVANKRLKAAWDEGYVLKILLHE